MVSRRVKDSQRRRSARACQACKRRKERCDGSQPCGRCLHRRVDADCTFVSRPRPLQSRPGLPDRASNEQAEAEGNTDSDFYLPSIRDIVGLDHLDKDALQQPSPVASGTIHPAIPASPSRLITPGRDTFVCTGEVAISSFLQAIRCLVKNSSWASAFVDGSLMHFNVESTPKNQSTWIFDIAKDPPSPPGLTEARHLVAWYLYATNCLLNLHQESELDQKLLAWQRDVSNKVARTSTSAVFFLIFAIGAQTCDENRDDIAERYFYYGQFLTASRNIEDPDVFTVETYILSTMYLLGASRPNAAFMHLGTAVRAAYALGVERSECNMLHGQLECAKREHLWKAIRVLDIFMSASLGRPQATFETRDTTSDSNYSAMNELCTIFDSVLTEVYDNRVLSLEIVESISRRHRQWAAKFSKGLAADNIRPGEVVSIDGGKPAPNIGLIHLKEGYYITIMLLARPFLIESISSTMARAEVPTDTDDDIISPSCRRRIIVHAGVDSAIRTVDLLYGLVTAETAPKRLPFVASTLFVSGLVLGLAHFGDLDRWFPLEQSVERVLHLLSYFGRHDADARTTLAVMESLQGACRSYVEQRARQRMVQRSTIVGSLFGTVHAIPRALSQSEAHPRSQEPCPSSTPDATLDDKNDTGPETGQMMEPPNPEMGDGPAYQDLETLLGIASTEEEVATWSRRIDFDSFNGNLLFPSGSNVTANWEK